MRTLTRGHVRAGMDSVRGAKIRSFWTMLGVVIGVKIRLVLSYIA
jgi:hypothetical protein